MCQVRAGESVWYQVIIFSQRRQAGVEDGSDKHLTIYCFLFLFFSVFTLELINPTSQTTVGSPVRPPHLET